MARRFAGVAVLGVAVIGLGAAGASLAATGFPAGKGSFASGASAHPRHVGVPLPVIPHLRVTPASGGQGTVFTVHFTAGQPTGLWDGSMHDYAVTAEPQHPGRGCVANIALTPRVTRAGQELAIRLEPGRFGHRWCAGVYVGSVTETSGPGCGPVTNGTPVACPMYLALEHIGTFRFKVTH